MHENGRVGRILLQQDLLEPVGRQEDGMCQHEVIQQRFYPKKHKQREREKLVVHKRDLERR